MALHEEQVADSIVELEYEVYMLQEKLDYLMQYLDLSNIPPFDEGRLKKDAAKYIKAKFPDEGLRYGDWID